MDPTMIKAAELLKPSRFVMERLKEPPLSNESTGTNLIPEQHW